MNSTQHETPILDLSILIFKNLKKLLIFNFIVTVIAIAVLFSMKLHYRSTAVVVVQSETGAGGLASMVSQFMPFSFGFGGGSEAMKFMGILETKRVMEVVIDRYDLQTRYEKKTREETYLSVLESMELYDREDGTFSISFTMEEDPVLARDIVESLYEELVKITLELNQANAYNYRVYIEEAYKSAATTLESSELLFNNFQEKSGIVMLEDQLVATINTVTELETEKAQREIEINYLKQTMSADHPDLRNKMIELRTFEAKLAEIKGGGESYLLALENVPDNSLAYLRHYRDVMVNTKITEFLVLQLEQARIEEQKKTVNLYLLDPPHVPDKKYKPKRLSMLVIIMFFSGVFSLGYFILREYYRENESLIRSKLL